MAAMTLDLSASVLEELQQLQERESRPLGELVSELVHESLLRRRKVSAAAARTPSATTSALNWQSRKMGQPRIDLLDKDALYAILDAEDIRCLTESETQDR